MNKNDLETIIFILFSNLSFIKKRFFPDKYLNLLITKIYFVMKLKCFNLFVITLLIALNVIAKDISKDKPTLSIKFTFTGIVDSCDYINRINIFIDSVKIVTSSEKKQSEPNIVSFSIKKGKYKIKIIDEVFFQGKWEEQTIINDYNIDAIYECEIQIKENTTINLLFDLDKGVSVITP
jgi:hypothetical protein